MRYYKMTDADGKLTAIGTGTGGTEITTEEYAELSAEIAEKAALVDALADGRISAEEVREDWREEIVRRAQALNAHAEGYTQDALEAMSNAELERILSAVAGAGRVSVLLTEVAGGETVYQTQGEDGDTVLLTGSTRGETALVRRVDPPVYRGAVVVCQGGDNAAVRLAVVQAVMAVTGLNAQRITVLKMK